MRYTTHQYAESLFESLDGKGGKQRGDALRNFLGLLRRNGDYGRINQILRHYEKIHLARRGLVKIQLETPEKASPELIRSIETILGKPVVFVERENPKVLAGLVLLINDAILIDASAGTRLESLRAAH